MMIKYFGQEINMYEDFNFKRNVLNFLLHLFQSEILKIFVFFNP